MGAQNLIQRSEYSFLGSLLRLNDLVYYNALQGYRYCCVSDTLSTFAYYGLTRLCDEYGLHPVYGIELFVSGVNGRGVYPVFLYARNSLGLHHLFQLNSLAWTRFEKELSFCLSLETIREHSEGLFIAAEQEAVMHHDNYAYLNHYYEKMSDLFPGSFFQILNYTGPAKVPLIKEMLAVTSHYEVPRIAAAECRHLSHQGSSFQALNHIREKHFQADERGQRLDSRMDYSFRSQSELEHLFSRHPDILETTESFLAELQARLDIRHLPQSGQPIADTVSEESGWSQDQNLLLELKKYAVQEHLAYFPYQASLIPHPGFEGTLHELPAGDFPLLQFSRYIQDFLAIETGTQDKEKILSFIQQKYSRQQAAFCSGVTRISARWAARQLRDKCDVPAELFNQFFNLLPAHQSRKTASMAVLLRSRLSLQNLSAQYPALRELLSHLSELEGLPQYANANPQTLFILTPGLEKFVSLVPFHQDFYQAQIQHQDLSGHVPHLDLYAERYLSVLKECAFSLSWDQLSGLSPDFWKKLSESAPSLLLGYDSGRLMPILSRLLPSNLSDLCDLLALYENGYSREQYLRYQETRSEKHQTNFQEQESPSDRVYLYQEELFQQLYLLSGEDYSLSRRIWKDLSDKNQEKLQLHREHLLLLAVQQHKDPEIFSQQWALITASLEHNVSFSTTLSSAIRYCLVHMARDKDPLLFYASLFNQYQSYPPRLNDILGEIRKQGLNLLPPDLNLSEPYCRPYSQSIQCGLLFIKYLGLKTCQQIMEERHQQGRFQSMGDFLRRMQRAGLSRRQIESLIKSGVFRDEFPVIDQALQMYELYSSWQKEHPSPHQAGNSVLELFPAQPVEADMLPAPEAFNIRPERDPDHEQKIRNMEYLVEATGMYLEAHPIDQYREDLDKMQIDQLSGLADHSYVVCAVYLYHLRVIQTKDGREMAFASLSDPSGLAEAVFFPRVYHRFFSVIKDRELYLLKGYTQEQKIHVESLYLLRAVL